MLEANLDASGIDFGRAVSGDGTVFRSPAAAYFRTPTDEEKLQNVEDGKEPDAKILKASLDTEAKNGHYPSKQGFTKYAHGYEAHLLVPIPDSDELKIPMVVSGMSLQANTSATRFVMRDLVIDRADRYDMLLYDAGYDYKDERNFQTLLDHGIDPIFDPNKKLRKGKRTSNGNIIRDGDTFRPSTPKRLLVLADFAKDKTTNKLLAMEAMYDERDKYRMERVSYDSDTVRSMCPAQAGKVACPLVTPSLNIRGKNLPDVTPPQDPPHLNVAPKRPLLSQRTCSDGVGKEDTPTAPRSGDGSTPSETVSRATTQRSDTTSADSLNAPGPTSWAGSRPGSTS